MVKVLENKIIDLDLLPGKEQQELKAQIQEHIAKTGYAPQPVPHLSSATHQYSLRERTTKSFP